MVDRVVDGAVARIDAKFGMGRFLVVRVDAGEAAQITGSLPGVEPLHVAQSAHLDGRRHVDLEQLNAGSVVGVAHRIARRVVGGHDRGEDEHAVAGEPRGDPADPRDVGVAIRAGVPEVGRQHITHLVAVEYLDRDPVGPQAVSEGRGDCGLSGAGQPREPQGGADRPDALPDGLHRVSGSSRSHGCPLRRGPTQTRAGSWRTDASSADQLVAHLTRKGPGRATNQGAGRSASQTRRADDALQIDMQPCDQPDARHGNYGRTAQTPTPTIGASGTMAPITPARNCPPRERSSVSWRTPLIRRRARQYATLEVMNRVHPLWLTVRRHVDLRRVTSASCRVAS